MSIPTSSRHSSVVGVARFMHLYRFSLPSSNRHGDICRLLVSMPSSSSCFMPPIVFISSLYLSIYLSIDRIYLHLSILPVTNSSRLYQSPPSLHLCISASHLSAVCGGVFVVTVSSLPATSPVLALCTVQLIETMIDYTTPKHQTNKTHTTRPATNNDKNARAWKRYPTTTTTATQGY